MKTPSDHFVVFDDFLEPQLHKALLAHALAQADNTEPVAVYGGGERAVDRESRIADLCLNGLGPLRRPFAEQVMARFDCAIAALGIRPFAVADIQLELVAHNDGAIFTRHIDTLTEDDRPLRAFDRILSLVYYFHRQPKGFSGGELEILPLFRGHSKLVEPRDNRLVAFPSEVPHRVRRVSCPSREFAESRFAVNVWLGRSRSRA